jgi:hypothetical protein
MCRIAKTALWKQRQVMKAAAERTSLARLSLVTIRNAGGVPVAVKAKRGKKLFRRRSERGLYFSDLKTIGEPPNVSWSCCCECGNEEEGA